MISSLDLFKSKSGSYFNFSFLFLLLSFLVSAFLAMMLFYTIDFFYEISNLENNSPSPIALLLYSKNSTYLGEYISGSIILFIALYAVYINSIRYSEESGSFNKFFSFLSSKTWTSFFVVLAIYTLLNLIFYGGLLKTNLQTEETEGILGMINEFGEDFQRSPRYKFYKWIDDVFDLFLAYFPYVGALYIISVSVNQISTISFFKQKRSNILAVIVISFSIHTLIGTAVSYIDYYIIGIKDIIIAEQLSSTVFFYSVYLLIKSYFLILIAGVLLFTSFYAFGNEEDEEKLPSIGE